MAGFAQSRLAAWLQNLVAQRREESGLYREVAAQLPRLDSGRLLDIGTGSGLMRLYSVDELKALAQCSRFRVNHSVEPTSLQNLPIFVRISL